MHAGCGGRIRAAGRPARRPGRRGVAGNRLAHHARVPTASAGGRGATSASRGERREASRALDSARRRTMAEIRVEPKRRSMAWLWVLILLAVAAAVAWYFMSGRTETIPPTGSAAPRAPAAVAFVAERAMDAARITS